MEGLIEGRIVHYVLEDGRNQGEHRPAVVVKLWGDPKHNPAPAVQLAVLVDGTNDYANHPILEHSFMPVVWKCSVSYSEEPKPRTWHWIERA